MKRKLVWVALFGLVMLAAGPARVLAEGTTCGLPTVIVPDGRVVTSTIPNGATYYWLFDSSGGNSYSMEVKFTTAAWGNNPQVQYYDIGSSSCTNAITVTDTSGIDPEIPNTGERASRLATTSRHWITVSNATGATQTYSVSVSDTTMFSPSWSTNGSYDTFYSIQNTTNSTCTGTLTLRDTTGTVQTTASLTIPAGATASTNTSASGQGTARNLTGTAQFAHACPPGSLVGEAAIASFSISPPYVQTIKFVAGREATH